MSQDTVLVVGMGKRGVHHATVSAFAGVS